ncbi:Type-1 restriction enzyme EcoKI specificity protein (plasmid) [Komagataeibacter saccharivorans]|uniref:Type-1 restriction enzyme EcoKI specificity protein n=2 Tax=Komagataeibacter saccharivorans TaxID=265959 RepID=A0A347WHA2_9PROT|nr:Type-1 restriction enzyme EcoKI specificity protein [Komagataeibacter saccharivorans]
MYALRPKEGISSEFVLYTLLDKRFTEFAISVSARSGIPKINRDELSQFSFAVPPADEQVAIASALKDIDDLIASLDALIAKKRDIKQAAMQQLLTGKTRLPGFATTPMTNSAIGNLPSDWEVRPLGSLGDPVIGLTYRPVDVRETGTLVLRSSNVQDGVLAFDNNVFVDPEVASRALVAKGDILICVRNGSRALIGKCAMISDEAEGMAFGAFMSVFRSPHSDFLFHQFQSNIIQRQIHEHLGATINQITNASLRSFQVPFPVSAEERGAIVTILSDMDAELTGLTVKLSKLNMVREGMMQQLLTGRIRLV